MIQPVSALVVAAVMIGVTAGPQTAPKGQAGMKDVTHDVTINAEGLYTGTVRMVLAKGRVSGEMLLTSPTEITGKLAGTVKGDVVSLDFPYYMTERKCEGTVKMELTLQAKAGPATGTMEAVGCGRDETRKLLGTVELKPRTARK
jgi:hypothetical protein